VLSHTAFDLYQTNHPSSQPGRSAPLWLMPGGSILLRCIKIGAGHPHNPVPHGMVLRSRTARALAP
jgi:hypothetical protein